MVGRAERSGLTQAEFCRREGISLASLRTWKYRRLKPTPPGPTRAFVPVRLVEPSPAASGPIEVVLVGERRLRVAVGFDEQTLLRLVRLLG
jgi:hypothetical protein